MVSAETIREARKNGSRAINYWGKAVTLNEVVDLLASAAEPGRHIAVRRNANALLERMAKEAWVLAAGPHRGGIGGKGQAADKTPHITLFVTSSGYHLRINKSGHIFAITGAGMRVYHPEAAPGTEVGGHYRGQGK